MRISEICGQMTSNANARPVVADLICLAIGFAFCTIFSSFDRYIVRTNLSKSQILQNKAGDGALASGCAPRLPVRIKKLGHTGGTEV